MATSSNPLEPVPWLGWKRPRTSWTSFANYEPMLQERLRNKLKDCTAVLDSQDEDLGFLQSWFTFGLVESFVQKSLPDDALLSGEAPSRIFSLGELPTILLGLSGRLEEGSLCRIDWFRSAKADLDALRDYLDILRNQGPVNGEIESIPLNLLCLVLQVAEALTAAILELVDGDLALTSATGVVNWVPFSYSVTQWFQQKLIGEGWCPRVVACVDRLLLVSAWVHAATHSPSAERRDHSNCLPPACHDHSG